MKSKKISALLICVIFILNALPMAVPVSAATSARGVTSNFSVSADGNNTTEKRISRTDTIIKTAMTAISRFRGQSSATPKAIYINSFSETLLTARIIRVL